MPTSITVPVGQRNKSIQFGAPYSPSQTFNPDKDLFFNCSGILYGMDITVNTGPTPNEVTVGTGAFIQNGIIVELTSSQLVQAPNPPTFPVYLVAENANEVFNSNVDILFTTTPDADSAIIAEWGPSAADYTEFTDPLDYSICALHDEIELINKLVIQRERQVAGGGQTVFILPAEKSYVLGANKVWVYRNGKKLDITTDYTETDSTTVTLTAPATAGDVLEFVIFKSEPPITSIALNDLTDVTGDLANAIKDTGANRANPATQTNFLASIDDVSAAVSASESGQAVQIFETTVSAAATGVYTTKTLTHSLNLTSITPVTDFTTLTGAHRAIFSYTCDQGLVIIEQDTAQYRVDGGVGTMWLLGATDAAGNPGLTATQCTFRIRTQFSDDPVHAMCRMTFIPNTSATVSYTP